MTLTPEVIKNNVIFTSARFSKTGKLSRIFIPLIELPRRQGTLGIEEPGIRYFDMWINRGGFAVNELEYTYLIEILKYYELHPELIKLKKILLKAIEMFKPRELGYGGYDRTTCTKLGGLAQLYLIEKGIIK